MSLPSSDLVPAKLREAIKQNEKNDKPSGARALAAPPGASHRLLNPKWLPGGPKIVDRVWREVKP